VGSRASALGDRTIMVSVGVLSLIALAILAVAFMALASSRGMARAFVSFCWVPLAALILLLVQRNRLGLEALLLLMVILVLAVVLVGLGAALSVKASRRGDSSAIALKWGTLAAAVPLLILAAGWVMDALH